MRKTDRVAVMLRKKKNDKTLKTMADRGKRRRKKAESGGQREKSRYVIKVNFQPESIHHVDDAFNSQ